MGLMDKFFGGKKDEPVKAHGVKATVKDPVCHMTVDEKKAAATSDYKGQKYYFCAMSCKKAFDQNPAKYAEGSPAAGHSGHHM